MKTKNPHARATHDWKTLREALRQRTSISSVELSRLVRGHTGVAVDYAVWRLQQEGVLVRRRRGLYLITEGEKHDAFLRDPIEAIHSLIGEDVVFGYGTALYVHGLSRYGRVTEYYVLTETDKKPRNTGDFVVRFVENPVHNEVGVIKRKFGRSIIRITDLERTLIDCIHRPKYAQGWENVMHALKRAEKVNGRRVIEYLKQYGIPSLVAKVGPLLEHFAKDWNVHSGELDSLLQYRPRHPVRMERGLKGKLNKKWNIFLPGDLLGK